MVLTDLTDVEGVKETLTTLEDKRQELIKKHDRSSLARYDNDSDLDTTQQPIKATEKA